MFDLGPSYVPAPPMLEGGGIRLRPPRYSDYKAWAELRVESRAFLEPWEPTWEADMLTRSGYRARIRVAANEWREDRGFSFHIFTDPEDTLVGGINVSGVRRRAAQYGSLGYWMGERYAGQGIMSAAMRLLLPALFQEFGLHRVEAACIPENGPSKTLLEKFGFQKVGVSKGYLKINGAWRDHLLFELHADYLIGARGMKTAKSRTEARSIDQTA